MGISRNSYLLSIIIPAYNEQQRIIQTIQKICSYFSQRNRSIEIIVVDDGSKDDTVALLTRESSSFSQPITTLHNRKNRGKGYSIKKGMLHAKGDIRLFTDADLSTPIAEY